MRQSFLRTSLLGFLAVTALARFGEPTYAADGLHGRVIPFSDVQFGANNDRRTGFSIDVTVSPNSDRNDWGVTATELARIVLKDAKLQYIKVTVLRADEERLMPIRINRELAVVYYGPYPATSPWPDEPFAMMLYDRALSEAEIRAEDEFNKKAEDYSRKYGEEKGDKRLNDLVAKKFKLPTNWHIAVLTRMSLTNFTDLSLISL